MKWLVWIASYPKSGNTWMRMALTSLLNDGHPVDINRFTRPTDTGAFSREIFDGLMDVDSSELTSTEILAARPAAFRRWAMDSDTISLLKVHEAFIDTPNGEPLFPDDATRAAIHIVRDPRDVAVSMAHFFAMSLDAAIAEMAAAALVLAPQHNRARATLPQPVSTWSEHTRSWLDRPTFPVLTLRYEDMLADMETALTAAAATIGIDTSPAAIHRAITATDFTELRRQESATGFQERFPAAAHFFRRGIAGGWRDELSTAQADRIVADHGAMMRRLGYL